jgi:phosphoserine phosphatase
MILKNNDWLLVSDVDGTLTTETSIWEYLHKHLGKWNDEGLPNLDAYLAGTIDYNEFALRDASAYKGLSQQTLNEIAASIPRRFGMEQMLKTFKRRGFTLALVSTGLDILVNQIPEADIRLSNGLEFENGICTGRPIVSIPMDAKESAFASLLTDNGFSAENTIVLGDSAGDIPMMRHAGYSIAVASADRDVLRVADANVDGNDLMRIPALVEEYRETVMSRRARLHH